MEKKSLVEIIQDTDFIGYLNGEKCPNCCGTLLEDNKGNKWCSQMDCSYGLVGKYKDSMFQQKFWNYHLMQANKQFKNVLASYYREKDEKELLISKLNRLTSQLEDYIEINEDTMKCSQNTWSKNDAKKENEVYNYVLEMINKLNF